MDSELSMHPQTLLAEQSDKNIGASVGLRTDCLTSTKAGGVERVDAEGKEPVAVVAPAVLAEAVQVAIMDDGAAAAPRRIPD